MLNLHVAWDAGRTPCCSGSRTMAQGSSDSTTWDFDAGSRGINARQFCLPIAFEQKLTQKLIKCIFSYWEGNKHQHQNVATKGSSWQFHWEHLVWRGQGICLAKPCGDGPLPHQLQGLCWPRRIGLCL